MLELAESLRETYEVSVLVTSGAFFLGLLFGWFAEISGYCTRSAVVEWAQPQERQSGNSTLQVAAAILAALAGTLTLHLIGLLDLSEAIYWSQTIKPVALIAGGVLFGIGMILSRGCISRLLVLGASGNLRAVVTLLVAAIAAYATLRGILSYPRIWLETAWDTGVPATSLFANGPWLVPAAAAIAAVALAIVVQTIRTKVSSSFSLPIVFGIAIGLLIPAAWILTGVIGADEFDPAPLASLSFVAPGAETLQFAMIYTGDTLRFGIALVLGTLVGAFVSSLVRGNFHHRGFTAETPVWRYISGGLLMGFGGVTALGCTVGQGLSGLGSASPAAMIAFASILAGAYGAIKLQTRYFKSAADNTVALPAAG